MVFCIRIGGQHEWATCYVFSLGIVFCNATCPLVIVYRAGPISYLTSVLKIIHSLSLSHSSQRVYILLCLQACILKTFVMSENNQPTEV